MAKNSEGFYVTDLGTQKIAEAAHSGTKVNITKMAVGTGGDLNAERDYSITELNNQTYSKTFDENDRYEISETDGNTILIECRVPDDAGEMLLNEVGYLDDQDNLIIYGVTKTMTKLSGSTGNLYEIVIASNVTFVNDDLEYVNLVIGTEGIRELEKDLRQAQSTLTTLSGKVDGLVEKQDDYVEKREGYGLSENDFSSDYKEKVDKNTKGLDDLKRIVAEKGDTSEFTEMSEEIAGVKSSVSSINSSLSALTRRVSALESTLSGLESTMESLI